MKKKSQLKNENQVDTNTNVEKLEQSKNFVIKNNYWNNEHHKILLLIHNYSNKLYKEYHSEYLSYTKRLHYYRVPIIVMSSISGFLSISNSGYIPDEYNKWVSLFVGFSNLAVTVISLIENFKKIDVNLNKSYNAYNNFKKLNDELSLILRIPANERENNGFETVNLFFTKFESHMNDAPILKTEVFDYLEFKDAREKVTKFNDNSHIQILVESDSKSDSDDSLENLNLNNLNSPFKHNTLNSNSTESITIIENIEK